MQLKEYEKDLTLFDEICEDLKTCKYILASVRIVNLLKCIADSDVLYAELEHCLEDFNYDYEFHKAKVPSNDDSGSKYQLILPIEPSKKVALIFRILYDIELKVIDFPKFLSDFYYADNEPYLSYQHFANHLIVEFQANFEYLITGYQRLEESPVVVYNEELRMEDRTVIDLVEILKKITNLVNGEDVKPGYREEILIVTNGFANSLITLRPEHILICWIGFKNTIKDFKKALPLVKKIEEKLKRSGLFNI